jgi:hypothetical protein
MTITRTRSVVASRRASLTPKLSRPKTVTVSFWPKTSSQDELRRIGELTAAAREGRGGALVLLGEAGVGKTPLPVHPPDRPGPLGPSRRRGPPRTPPPAATAGGYRLTGHAPGTEQVTLVGVVAITPEVIAAANHLSDLGAIAGVVCLTSPDLVFRSAQGKGGDIAGVLFPDAHPAPLVTVLDGHPHTLAFLAGLRGDRTRNLGVTEFGQSSDLADAYRLHGIDTVSIVDAALALTGR